MEDFIVPDGATADGEEEVDLQLNPVVQARFLMDREAVDRKAGGAFRARSAVGALKRLGFSLSNMKSKMAGTDIRRGLHQVDRALAKDAAKAERERTNDAFVGGMRNPCRAV